MDSGSRSGARGAYSAAGEQFEDAVRLRKLKTAPRQRLEYAITLIDAMVGKLEQLNLTGSALARGSLEVGISALRQLYPGTWEIRLRGARSTEKLMDELVEVQHELLAMRAGPEWELAGFDEDFDGAEAAPVQREA